MYLGFTEKANVGIAYNFGSTIGLVLKRLVVLPEAWMT
jgi:hypothetical protein